MKKKMFIKSIMIVLVFCLTNTVSAHNPNQHGLVVGGENVGWRIDVNEHHNGTIMRYGFNTSYTQLDNHNRKTHTRNGAALWTSPYVIVEETAPFPVGTGHIITGSVPKDPGTNAVAVAWFEGPFLTPTNGHINAPSILWRIAINTHSDVPVSALSSRTMAHEFGHAFGLLDLYDDCNRNKLMFYSTSSTATSPTTADRHGASVITGHHTHSSGPWPLRHCGKNWTANNKMRNTHREGCNTCGGYKGATIGGTTTMCNIIGSNGGCSLCLTHRNGDVNTNGTVSLLLFVKFS